MAGTVFVAVGQEFAPEQHPVVAQGVADDEPPVGQAEHEGEGAIPELTDDLGFGSRASCCRPSGSG